jgi:hypothetical protein
VAEPAPFPTDTRRFIECTVWTFAKTHVATRPHKHGVRAPENGPILLALARHIFKQETGGRRESCLTYRVPSIALWSRTSHVKTGFGGSDDLSP